MATAAKQRKNQQGVQDERKESQVRWADDDTESSKSEEAEDEDSAKDNILTVKVSEAKDLVAADRGGTSDPYVVVEFQAQSRKTKTIKQTINPKWNESFQFEIGRPSGIVGVRVYDYDMLNAHDFLGQVELDLSNQQVEAVQEGWFDLQPRSVGNDVVAGSMFISLVVLPKNKKVQDTAGFDGYAWLRRDDFQLPPPKRTQNIIRIYLATTFVDFQDEIGKLHAVVFPKLQELCLTKGYSFSVVDMRWGLDEKQDRMYMHDPRMATFCLHEIAECRRISPGANFLALLGDRYGPSPLPLTLDKNELMAIRGKLSDDADGSEEAEEALALLSQWYVLDENQIPNRFILAPSVGDVSPSSVPGTPQHSAWLASERNMFAALETLTGSLLAPVRLCKYRVSLLEHEVLLGALLPPDAPQHAVCFIRNVANLRVVNPNAAKFVDITSRRGNALTDTYKEVRPDMVDEGRRGRLLDLKERVKARLHARCPTLLTQWLGWTIGGDHLSELCEMSERLLASAAEEQMRALPRVGFMLREVQAHSARQQHAWRQLVLPPPPGQPPPAEDSVVPDTSSASFQRVRAYLQAVSDGAVRPLVLRGGPGSGVSALMSLAVAWARHNWPPGAVTVYREVGLTPDSCNGTALLFGVTKELTAACTTDTNQTLTLHCHVLRAAELPVADTNLFGGGGSSDPYVQVEAGGATHRTSVKKKTLDPDWGEEERMVAQAVAPDGVVRVTVWDYDMLSKNDLLGQAEIPLSSLQVHTEYERWVPVPLEPAPPPAKTSVTSLTVRVVEAHDIVPLARRMTVDPFITLRVGAGGKEAQTSVQAASMDPAWGEAFELLLPAEEDTLWCELWDKNEAGGEAAPVGRCAVGVGGLGATRTVDDWFDVRHDGFGAGQAGTGERVLGRVHLVVTKNETEQDEATEEGEAEEEEREVEGPRVLLRLRLVATPRPPHDGVETATAPCGYLSLCEALQGALSRGSASQPLLLAIDGLDRLPSSDPAASLRWLPPTLPRYVYLLLGVNRDPESQSDAAAAPSAQASPPPPSGLADAVWHLDNRRPPPEVTWVSGLEPDECRRHLNAALQASTPPRALAGEQRATLLRSFAARASPMVLQTALALATAVPSSYRGQSLETPSLALREVLAVRAEYPPRGRVDIALAWRALEFLAVTPQGLTETDLRQLLAGGGAGGRGPCPYMLWAEVRYVLQPLLSELAVDGVMLLGLRHEGYRGAVLHERLEGGGQRDAVVRAVRSLYEERGEFDGGGQIDERKLRVLPELLATSGESNDFEAFVTDLHLVELRLCARQLFDLERQLAVAGPGQGGRAEELLGFLEASAGVLERSPRMLLQLALNMPDHSPVYLAARRLDVRRRRGFFFALAASKGAGGESAEEQYLRRRQLKAAGKGDTDLETVHPLAMEWRRARPWLRWANKPQSRGQCKRTLRGHLAPATGALFLGAALIVSASADRTVRVWSAQTAEELRELGTHSKAVTVIAAGPDRSVLVTGGEDGVLVVWAVGAAAGGEVTFPAERRRIRAHRKRVTGVAFASARVAVVSSEDEEVRLFDVDSGEETGSFVPFRFGVSAVACTPPGKISLIAAAGHCHVRLVRGDTLERRGALYGHRRRVTGVQFSHSGDRIATSAWDGTVAVWDQVAAREWTRLLELRGHSDAVRGLAWAPDDRTIVTASADKTIKIWEIEGKEEEEEEEEGEGGEGADTPRSAGEGEGAGGGEGEGGRGGEGGGGVGVARASLKGRGFGLLATLTGHAEAVMHVTFHPQGSLILSSARDGDVRVWDVKVPRSSMGVASHPQAILAVASGRVGGTQVVASAGADGFVRVWDAETAREMRAVQHGHAAAVTALRVSSSGAYVVSGSKDGLLKRWDAAARGKGETEVKAKAHRGGVGCLEALHAGDFFVSGGSQDGRVTVWDGASMLDVISFEMEGALGVLRATFSTDGKFVISGDSGGSVRVWSIEGGRQVLGRQLGSGTSGGELACIDFSPGGERVATATSKSHVITIWNAAQGLALEATMEGHCGAVTAMSFGGAGQYLCSLASGPLELVVWDAPAAVSVARFLCDFAPTALIAGPAWPLIGVGDTKGGVYLLQYVAPAPVEPEEEEEVARDRHRLRSRRKSTATSPHV